MKTQIRFNVFLMFALFFVVYSMFIAIYTNKVYLNSFNIMTEEDARTVFEKRINAHTKSVSASFYWFEKLVTERTISLASAYLTASSNSYPLNEEAFHHEEH
jgi:hypothetical protein